MAATTVAFKVNGLSEKAKKALERAPNKSEYIRRAIELYESRSEYEVILNQLGELKELVKQLAAQRVEYIVEPGLGKNDVDSKREELEQELLAGLDQF